MTERAATDVALPAGFDPDSIGRVRDSLIEAMRGGPVRVSGAAVERVSTNALFLLISAADTARRDGRPFELCEPSETMRAAIDRLGLAGRFAGFTRQ
jgi:anti-anti-sigma regulatory factor